MIEECKSKEIKKEIFLENLPKYETLKNKGNINWKECIGYKIKGIYDDLEFEVEIAKYESKGQHLYIKYKDKEPYKIKTGNFSNCQLGELLKEESYTYDYDETNPRRIDLRGFPLYLYGIDWIQMAKDKTKVPFVYDDIVGEVEISDYDGKYLFIKYKDKTPFKIATGNFQKCQLGKLLEKYTSEFKVEIGTQFKDNKRDIIIIDREYRIKYHKNNKKYNKKWYKYKCLKCGWDEGWMTEEQLKSTGCACCCSAPKTVVKGINDIPTTNPEMIQYFQSGIEEARLYTIGSGQKIYPVCPDCGRIKSKPMQISTIYRQHSIGCKECGDNISYPNKLMCNVLEQLNIKFETEYNPDWVKPKRYDFYFELDNNKKYIVEMDGSFHNKDNKMNGQTKKESQEIDEFKDRLASKHNIEVIRIDSEISDLDYIKSNILIKLDKILNLSNIDWLKVEKFALSNLVKKACELKRDNPEMTTGDIGKIMKLSYATIGVYLKKGNSLGWCNYNPKEERSKGCRKSTNGKLVEVFKDNIGLGIFESTTELEEKSIELFGVKLNHTKISAVCLGKRDHHQGFTFKYIG